LILVDISSRTREQGRAIISAGAIPMIVEKLRNRINWMGRHKTELSLVWCVMNLATDGEEFRNILVAHELDKILVQTFCFQAKHID
jgi:hypothetical protein